MSASTPIVEATAYYVSEALQNVVKHTRGAEAQIHATHETGCLIIDVSDDPVDRLTTRERDVLQLMAEGLSDKGIAERLYLSPNTIGTHVQHIFRSPPPTAVTTTPTLPTSA